MTGNAALRRALTVAMTRELLRDRSTLVFVIGFPPALLALFELIAGATPTSLGEGATALTLALPAILVFGFGSLAVHGTAAPLVELRRRGTLRLLATTPMSRLDFIVAQLPARAALAVVQLGVALPLAVALGAVRPLAVPELMLSLLLGLTMLSALGFLFGGRMQSPELVSGMVGGLLPVALMASGVLVPLDVLPGWLQTLSIASPLTYLGDAVRHDVVGAATRFPLPLDLAVMGLASTVLIVLAARSFRWDEEGR
jgi:ABC-2 type transport system permease protein